MSATEDEFLDKLVDVLLACTALQAMVPDTWPEEVRKRARTRIGMAALTLGSPRDELHLWVDPQGGICSSTRKPDHDK